MLPYRSSQYPSSQSGIGAIGPFISGPVGNLSELSSFAYYPMPTGQGKVDTKSAQEKAQHARELELKIIRQTLRRSKAEQIDEIQKSHKWEMDTLRQELTAEAESKIA